MAARPNKKKIGRPTLGTENVFRRYGGLPVKGDYGWDLYNAKMPVGIPVKQSHIDAAIPKSPPECVVGLAIDDFFDHKYLVEVGLTVVHIIDEKNKRRLTFSIPSALCKRLRLFDKMAFWDLPPAVYFIQKVRRKKVSKKSKSGAKTVSVTNNQRVERQPIRKAAKRKKDLPTRLIRNGRIIGVRKKKS